MERILEFRVVLLSFGEETERRRGCLPSLFWLGCLSEFVAICLVWGCGEKSRLGESRMINLGLDMLNGVASGRST